MHQEGICGSPMKYFFVAIAILTVFAFELNFVQVDECLVYFAAAKSSFLCTVYVLGTVS